MRFELEELNELILDMEELASLPDEIILQMLEAEAEVVKAAQVRSIQETFSQDRTHQLEASLKVNRTLRRARDGSAYITMTPSGVRTNGVRNAEVAFVEEFGAKNRGIPAHQWMRRANESAADDAVEAAARVYDRYLKEKGL